MGSHDDEATGDGDRRGDQRRDASCGPGAGPGRSRTRSRTRRAKVFPHYGTGVPLAVARQVLSVLFAASALSAVVLTEVNPSYDPAGDSLRRYIAAVADALITGLVG
jgi:hypothetical protein